MRRALLLSCAVCLLGIGALTASAYSRESETQWVRLVLGGSSAESYVGRWYNADGGRVDLRVDYNTPDGPILALRAHRGFVPLKARATSDALEIDFASGSTTATMILTLVALDRPEGSSTSALMMHNYWLLREPSLAWRAACRIDNALERAARTVERGLDWLVRAL